MFEIIIGIGIDSEALSTKMQVILKKYDFFYPDFFRLNILFCVAIASVKHKLKRGVTVLVSWQNDNKGTISASNDHFAQGDWGEFQDKHLFSQVEL